MVNFIKVRVKRSVNLKDEYNNVLVNLNNIVKVERKSNTIEFLLGYMKLQRKQKRNLTRYLAIINGKI